MLTVAGTAYVLKYVGDEVLRTVMLWIPVMLNPAAVAVLSAVLFASLMAL